MEQLGKYTVMVFAAFALSLFSYLSKSSYLTVFFSDNAILIGVAVFAIHAASSAILISQLAILGKNLGINFTPTCKSIQKSFIEFFLLLFGIMACAIFARSAWMQQISGSDIWLPTLLLFCVIAILVIVYDVCKAILICFRQPIP